MKSDITFRFVQLVMYGAIALAVFQLIRMGA